MTDRYARIREALAMGPTSGPWRCEHETGGGHDCWMMYSGDWPKAGGIVGYYTHTGPRHIPHVRPNTEAVAIAHHIAACDPDTIRALLEERDALEAENARLREALVTNEALAKGNFELMQTKVDAAERQLAEARELVRDLSDDLCDEGCCRTLDGLMNLRRRVADLLPNDVCPDWLLPYRTGLSQEPGSDGAPKLDWTLDDETQARIDKLPEIKA